MFTSTARKTDPVVSLAARKLAAARQCFAEYAEACESEYRQGYRPSACIHGVSQWTDYDNICGWCEDGYGYWDYTQQAELALGESRAAFAEYAKRRELYSKARELGATESLKGEIFDWVMEALR